MELVVFCGGEMEIKQLQCIDASVTLERGRRAETNPRAVYLQSLVGTGMWIGGHEEIPRSTAHFKRGDD
jgi:hypothetical protein